MEREVLEIVSFTDPYCTWCWGSEPILRKIQDVYGNQVSIQNREAENAFREDLAECLRRDVRGFPSFLLRGFGEEILLRGYTSYQTFE